MSQIVPLVILGVVVVLLPFGVISLFASRFSRQQRIGIAVLYAAGILLLIVLSADIDSAFPNRLSADVTLLIGRFVLGFLGGWLIRSRRRAAGHRPI